MEHIGTNKVKLTSLYVKHLHKAGVADAVGFCCGSASDCPRLSARILILQRSANFFFYP